MTIDLNFSELEYLSNHLTPEECRRLVAAAHFKSYMQPNPLDEAEHAMPKDLSCLELLLHWNSAEGEGRGETHEVLEHRLRQMGKYELADWLGKTVFHQLGQDLERSLHESLKDNENATVKRHFRQPTLVPKVDSSDSESSPISSIIIFLVSALGLGIVIMLVYIIIRVTYRKCQEYKAKKADKHKKTDYYEMVSEYTSDAESEENRFDVRDT